MANDESIEKTASTVEMATTKVERTTSKNASATTGRTVWDALVDMAGMLGRYTPWIIIVAGALYGTYKFRELERDAAQQERDAVKKETAEAYAALRSTYSQVGEMHQQQLANLSSMLKVNKETAENTEQQRGLLKELQEEIRTKLAVAEKAQKDADQATAAANSAENARRLAQTKVKKALIDLRVARQDITKKVGELSRKEKAVEQRATHIMDLRGKLIDMAKSMVDSTDSSVATLGKNILKEDSLEANKSLAAYAEQPGKDTAKSLDDLVGSSEETLETALSEGLGFTLWQKYSMKDGTKTAYIGVVRQTDVIDEGFVWLTVREKKVVNVIVFPGFSALLVGTRKTGINRSLTTSILDLPVSRALTFLSQRGSIGQFEKS